MLTVFSLPYLFLFLLCLAPTLRVPTWGVFLGGGPAYKLNTSYFLKKLSEQVCDILISDIWWHYF